MEGLSKCANSSKMIYLGFIAVSFGFIIIEKIRVTTVDFPDTNELRVCC